MSVELLDDELPMTIPAPSFPGVLELCDGIVRAGSHAGLPGFQPLLEWKGGVLVARLGALSADDREAAAIELPEDTLARLDAQEREFEALDVPIASLSLFERSRLEWLALAPVVALTPEQSRVLAARGVLHWDAGYTRYSGHLWVERLGLEPCVAYVQRSACPAWRPAGFTLERADALWCARWCDRVLRALTGGVVSEPALLLARRLRERWDIPPIDPAPAWALEVGARIARGDEEIEIPRWGTARAITLPGFDVDVADRYLESATRKVRVPEEQTYVLR